MPHLQYVILSYSVVGFVMSGLIIWLIGQHYWLQRCLKKLKAQHEDSQSSRQNQKSF